MTTPPDKPRLTKPFVTSNEKEPAAKYAKLTEAERLTYHTHVYAFRRVYGNALPTERNWDGDQEGKYFNEALVDAEQARLLIKKQRQDGSAKRREDWQRDPRNDPVVQAQRKAWVTHRGYLSWDHYLDAVAAGREKVSGFLAWVEANHPYPRRAGTFQRAVPPAAAE